MNKGFFENSDSEKQMPLNNINSSFGFLPLKPQTKAKWRPPKSRQRSTFRCEIFKLRLLRY